MMSARGDGPSGAAVAAVWQGVTASTDSHVLPLAIAPCSTRGPRLGQRSASIGHGCTRITAIKLDCVPIHFALPVKHDLLH